MHGEDADAPSGPEAVFGSEVTFNYVVTNPGSTSLANVTLTDDRLSNVNYVEGDANNNGLLEAGEKWIYTASETALVGQVTNTGTVSGTAVDAQGNPLGLPDVTDQDDANYIVVGGPAIDVEKYVKVAGYTPAVAMICETLGKPLSMTFEYEIGTTVDTDQASDKAKILQQSGVEDDGVSYVLVTDKSNATDLGGKVFFQGNVAVGAAFTAAVSAAADKFGSATYVHFFDDNPFDSVGSNALLQSLTYHTSCSQPINLGDTVGNVSLVGYTGENGTIDPNVWYGEDADTGSGPQALIGSTVEFNYVVTNPGSAPLANVTLTDDRLSNVVYVEGDDNNNGLLEAGEKWIFTATETAKTGQTTNIGTAKGTAVNAQGQDLGLPQVSDQDAAAYTGVDALFPTFAVCDEYGKPKALKLDYEPGSIVATSQGSDKAKILFDSGLVDDDGVSYILVTDKSNATDLGGKEYFMGAVAVGDEFIASTAIAGTDKFGSNTYIHIFDDNPFDSVGSNQLLQSVQYHTSCSQPIYLGDEIGGVTLVGYQGETGQWGIA